MGSVILGGGSFTGIYSFGVPLPSEIPPLSRPLHLHISPQGLLISASRPLRGFPFTSTSRPLWRSPHRWCPLGLSKLHLPHPAPHLRVPHRTLSRPSRPSPKLLSLSLPPLSPSSNLQPDRPTVPRRGEKAANDTAHPALVPSPLERRPDSPASFWSCYLPGSPSHYWAHPLVASRMRQRSYFPRIGPRSGGRRGYWRSPPR